MLNKRRKKRIPVMAGAGLFALLIGASMLVPKPDNWFGQWLSQSHFQPENLLRIKNPEPAVIPLVSLSPAERAEKLEALAQGLPSEDRNRARYLLGSDLIDQKEPRKALSFLEGLEKDYKLLAPYILLKQAQAYEMIGATKQAWDIREQVLKRYPKDPAAAKAMYLLGQEEPGYRDAAIAAFPSHPLTWEIARQRLKSNPNQSKLMLLLARHAYDQQPGILPVLDKLVSQFTNSVDSAAEATLKPQDWETIGLGYWDNNVYGKAGAAYARAPRTPRNLYRAGRGFQLGDKKTQAIAAYQKLVKAYPDAKETGTALLRLAELAKTGQEGLPYLDQVIAKFPDQAGEALVKKAKTLDALGSPKAATEARQLLISKYAESEAAAEYRWKVALSKAEAQDYKAAWQWAGPIPAKNPKSILAPRAGFWVGKWATKLGQQQEAKEAFEYVLSNFPHSYYAWRSAAVLGLNVGNFNTVRQLSPEVMPLKRPEPPAGSEIFKELYLLGQDRDAWMHWQAEFLNKKEPTVAEQFTEGLMRLAQGENLIGIAKISLLEDRETPQEKAEYQALSQQKIYWQARYPFPYLKEIETWSQKRQLNPLLVTALIRQESRFEPKIRSVVGAVGLMQVMPGTSKWIAEKIKLQKYDAEAPNDNILLGTWFLDFTHQEYDNNSLLAIASYNAGPGNVSKWLGELNKSDPDEFVEEIPFDETQGYVRQVFGNYWNYLRLYNPEISQLVAKYSTVHPKLPTQ